MKITNTENRTNEQELTHSLRSASMGVRRKAENQLFLKYYYFIREATKKYELTEDVLFDAYSDTIMAGIQAIQKGSFRENCSVKTYLYQIFHFKCVDVLRKKTTRKNNVHQTIGIDDLNFNMSDNSQSVLEQLITRSDRMILKSTLKKLCDKSQRLILLSVEGYTDKEIAKVMNFKTGQVVKTSRLRCIRKLRQLYDYSVSRIAV